MRCYLYESRRLRCFFKSDRKSLIPDLGICKGVLWLKWGLGLFVGKAFKDQPLTFYSKTKEPIFKIKITIFKVKRVIFQNQGGTF